MKFPFLGFFCLCVIGCLYFLSPFDVESEEFSSQSAHVRDTRRESRDWKHLFGKKGERRIDERTRKEFAETGHLDPVHNIEMGKFGPILHFRPQATTRPLPNLSTLTIMSQNFENLVTKMPSHRGNTGDLVPYEKPVNQLESLGRRVMFVKPDILVGMEIESAEIAKSFSHNYLGDEYEPLLIPGNDQRGINICFFVKKDLPLEVEVQSHKLLKSPSHPEFPLFSRDLPILFFRPKGQPGAKPIFSLVGEHMKSQSVTPEFPESPHGDVQRTEQSEATVKYVTSDVIEAFGPIPVFIAGDFNNEIPTAPEFNSLRDHYKNAFDVAPDGPPVEQRGTKYYFPRTPDGTSSLKIEQLDGVLYTGPEGIIKSARIQRDIKPDGTVSGPPSSYEEMKKRGSDHDGIVLLVDFAKMLKDSENYRVF